MLLDLLRDRTKHLHERIERTVDLPSRLGSTASYTALLTRFFGYYAPLEERLFAIGDIGATGIDLVARRKAPLLHADLISLGLCEADLLALPRCPELPAVVDASDALGCLYVTEGATLGGQMVRREVERRLGLTPGHGGRSSPVTEAGSGLCGGSSVWHWKCIWPWHRVPRAAS